MAATTTQLGLVTPTQGDLTGTWGDVVNNGITEYTNIAIAGTTTFNGDGAVTLVNTTGNASASGITSTSAQYAIVRVTGTLTTTKVITFGSAGSPPYSKLYLVDNAATGGSVNFVPYGGSGVTLAVGEKAFVYYNGTNIVQLTGVSSTGVVPIADGGTGSATAPGAYANILGFTTTATAGSTTTLTNTSSVYQQFTGSSPQTIQLPVTSTLQQGWSFHIVNNSTFSLTVNSSGGNAVITVPPQTTTMCTCVVTGGTGASDWEAGLTDFSNTTGTGSVVLNTSATLVSPLLGTPGSGTLVNCTQDGTTAVGFLSIPQNSQSAAYTTVLADSGKCVFHPASDANARTFTIAANSSVPYPIGTVIQFINMTSQVVTIACNTDTLTWAQTGGSGSRSLAQYGVANVVKITSTQWLLTGTNVT
jgi:hypothetical protein